LHLHISIITIRLNLQEAAFQLLVLQHQASIQALEATVARLEAAVAEQLTTINSQQLIVHFLTDTCTRLEQRIGTALPPLTLSFSPSPTNVPAATQASVIVTAGMDLTGVFQDINSDDFMHGPVSTCLPFPSPSLLELDTPGNVTAY
jgi:3-methyladenine DNA glycosylase/8-oxoguanine DNA glycosylase